MQINRGIAVLYERVLVWEADGHADCCDGLQVARELCAAAEAFASTAGYGIYCSTDHYLHIETVVTNN
jgi:hypothetical protein